MSQPLRIVHVSSRIVLNQNERVGRWMEERGSGTYHPRVQCIGYERDGRLVAGVMYECWNDASLWIHVAGEGKHWLTREFLRVAFDYPFGQLKAKVLVGLVPANNERARRFDEHLGFKYLATIPHGHKDGDLLIYTMLADECRWWRTHGR